ncbi:ABC transporter ATP-binding protein [Actinacidiphila paucisporea]|uniref:Putative ABC transport system ATP-binding protein n=1 Tax=Actinacidiphila paucisporea TaxID=310782 RepID=A0A1M7C496_9ACTN|nr:ATP-binding cassette domain-containing protein [Actinacidiphila paucisporea]SHL62034.1 putative ABC transport system ATP-binding protein [Actinacidiphila paucisporea]
MTSADVLVDARDAARTYGRGPTAVVAVHGATFQVRAGDRTAVVGPSGSGKSTLLHLLAGLERPSGGRVSWPGLDTPSAESAPIHQIGVVFQGPSLIPALDVVENTALPLVLAGVPEGQAQRRAQASLHDLGIAGLARRLPEELSGGQAQRVAIARVLTQSPRLVLADEPSGHLDRATADHVIDVLISAVDMLGAALVVTTHDHAVARRLAIRREMHEGRLIAPHGTQGPQS